MRLPELCLALLCAAAGPGPGSPGAAAGRAAEAGGGEPGAVAPRLGGLDPRQAWMQLAGSPGRASGSRARGRTSTVRDEPRGGRAGAPVAASAAPRGPAGLEELLKELQLLLKGTVNVDRKTRRKAGEGHEEEEESGECNSQARCHRRVEAAFHCQTRDNISIERRGRRELGIYYIPETEGMFHRGPGLNLTSGQYTAPVAGYYTFTATLRIARREQQRKGQPYRGNRLRVLICVESRCQHNSNLETVSRLESGGDLFTISVTGILYLQAGQYASVFVDNAAGSPLTVERGSDFSAVLLGV
ncbi:erythroferrone isoform 2-T2 [Pluvialis apricaria]